MTYYYTASIIITIILRVQITVCITGGKIKKTTRKCQIYNAVLLLYYKVYTVFYRRVRRVVFVPFYLLYYSVRLSSTTRELVCRSCLLWKTFLQSAIAAAMLFRVRNKRARENCLNNTTT